MQPNADKLEPTNTELTHGHLHSHKNSLFLYLLVITTIERLNVKNCVINYIFSLTVWLYLCKVENNVLLSRT